MSHCKSIKLFKDLVIYTSQKNQSKKEACMTSTTIHPCKSFPHESLLMYRQQNQSKEAPISS